MLCIAAPTGAGSCDFVWPFAPCGAACCCDLDLFELADCSARDANKNQGPATLVASIKSETAMRPKIHRARCMSRAFSDRAGFPTI
jgi:hypothetical protein